MMEPATCERCGRPILHPLPERNGVARHASAVIVTHDFYGCDTGCCGHRVVAVDCDGGELESRFEFAHPYDEHHNKHEEFARGLAAEFYPTLPLDWPNCEVVDD